MSVRRPPWQEEEQEPSVQESQEPQLALSTVIEPVLLEVH